MIMVSTLSEVNYNLYLDKPWDKPKVNLANSYSVKPQTKLDN